MVDDLLCLNWVDLNYTLIFYEKLGLRIFLTCYVLQCMYFVSCAYMYVHVYMYDIVYITYARIVCVICVCVCVCVCVYQWWLVVGGVLLIPCVVLCCVEAAEKKELERKQLEEKATLKKLQNLIEKEREKRYKKPKAKKTKRCIDKCYVCRVECMSEIQLL